MEKINLEFIPLTAEDVIATSGIGTDTNESGIPIIWLTKESVVNYNNFSKTDINLAFSDSPKNFFAYSGTIYQETEYLEGIPGYPEGFPYTIQKYSVSSQQDNTPDVYNVMAEGDAAMYNTILKWLQANG